jgi:hypothetical protein
MRGNGPTEMSSTGKKTFLSVVCPRATSLCALTCLLVAGCSAHDRPAASAGIDDDVAGEYVRLVSALGARDPDSLDYAYAPPSWTAEAESRPPPLPVIRRQALLLADRLAPDSDRRRHLVRQLRALVARVDVLSGKRSTFDQESRALFDVVAPAADVDEERLVRAELERRLPGPGPIGVRYAEFEGRFRIPHPRAQGVFARAIEGCRDRTREHLHLPPGEQVQVDYKDNIPWVAFSRYRGDYRSVIEVNQAYDMTVDGALALACHEAYPGHHTQNSLVETRLVRDRRWMEFTVQPLFSPQALLAEGAAIQAVDLAFPGPARVAFERAELFPLAGLDGRDADRHVEIERLVERLRPVERDLTRQYLDGDLEFIRAASAFEARALMPTPEPILKFINEYRSYAVTYTYGPTLVGSWIAARNTTGDVNTRWSLFETLITQPWTSFK